MRRRRKSKRRGRKHVQAKKVKIDGIQFASGLEAYCYKQLKENSIDADYERRSFRISRECTTTYSYYANWGGRFIKRKDKVLPITYTPDFEGKDFIIECKGRKNERYPLVIKLFRIHNEKYLKKTIYEPKTKEQVDAMIQLIKDKKQNHADIQQDSRHK